MSGPHPDPAELLAEAEAACSEDLLDAPENLVATRLALHSVAEHVLKPARERATGNEIALRWYPGGFGIPPFPFEGGVRLIKVEGVQIVDSRDGVDRRAPLTSLSAAGEHLGDLVDAEGLSGDELAIDPGAADFVARWFALATLVIAELQTGADAALDPGLVQLWPEHFDVATELGSEDEGKRAAYGASPGDEEHDLPYLYVAPWSEQPDAEVWNSKAFKGAELSYDELLAADDPRAKAAEFFAACTAVLAA